MTEVEVSEKMMRFAATSYSKSAMLILLDHGGIPTPDVVLAAAAEGTPSTLELLIGRGGTITNSALRYGTTNSNYSSQVTELLLNSFDQTHISHYLDELLCFATTPHIPFSRIGTIQKLLDRNTRSHVPKEFILQAVVTYGIKNLNLLIKSFLDGGKELDVTSEVLELAFRHISYDDTLLRLVERAGDIAVTTQLIVAAAHNRWYADEMFAFLIERNGEPNLISSSELLEAIASNAHSGLKMLRILENKSKKIIVTDKVIEAAAASGSPAVMNVLLKLDEELNITESMLKNAASTGETEVLKLLIKRCKSQIAVSQPIMDAAALNYESGKVMVDFLLSISKDVRVTTETLKAASVSLSEEDLKFFLSKSTAEEITSEVLIGAIEMNQYERPAIKRRRWRIYHAQSVVNLLLEASFDMKVTWDLLQAVTAYGKPALLSSLIDRDPHCISIIGDEILRTAATSGQEDMLKILSGMGAVDLETTAWRDIARLRNAALRGKAQAIKDLLSVEEVHLDSPDILGRTPLSLAAAPPPKKWWDHYSGPAAGSGQEETVKVLLKAGANIESKCHNGRTPLLWAAFEGYLAVVRILLDAGANFKVVDKNGKSAWDLARQGRYFMVAKSLEDARRKSE